MYTRLSMLDRIIHKWLKFPYPLYVHRSRKVKKARATVILLHGLGSSSGMWHQVVNELPSDIRIVTVDLLGFGKSPKPKWQVYNAKVQVKSLVATFLRLRIRGPVILVGHSMGALIAIEFAARYERYIHSLILLSPPLFKSDEDLSRILPPSDKIMKRIFKSVKKYPKAALRLLKLVNDQASTNPLFHVNESNFHTYVGALESNIINQTSLEDMHKLSLPIEIMYGRFDPLIINKNIKQLDGALPNIKIRSINARHLVTGSYIHEAVASIKSSIPAAGQRKKMLEGLFDKRTGV